MLDVWMEKLGEKQGVRTEDTCPAKQAWLTQTASALNREEGRQIREAGGNAGQADKSQVGRRRRRQLSPIPILGIDISDRW